MLRLWAATAWDRGPAGPMVGNAVADDDEQHIVIPPDHDDTLSPFVAACACPFAVAAPSFDQSMPSPRAAWPARRGLALMGPALGAFWWQSARRAAPDGFVMPGRSIAFLAFAASTLPPPRFPIPP